MGSKIGCVQVSRQELVCGCIRVHAGNEIVVDANAMHQAGGRFAVATGVLHVLGTTQTQHHSTALVEFIALGVAAEVIVIIQHQDFCLRPHFVLVEPGGGQAAHASTHNHKVIVLIRRAISNLPLQKFVMR